MQALVAQVHLLDNEPSARHLRSTVHPLGGPAIRQAGVVYRNNPLRCNSRAQILTSHPSARVTDRPEASAFSALVDACTEFNSHQIHIYVVGRSRIYALVKQGALDDVGGHGSLRISLASLSGMCSPAR